MKRCNLFKICGVNQASWNVVTENILLREGMRGNPRAATGQNVPLVRTGERAVKKVYSQPPSQPKKFLDVTVYSFSNQSLYTKSQLKKIK